MPPNDRRKGIALVPVLAIVCAVIVAAVCAALLAWAVTGRPAQPGPAAAAPGDAPKADEQTAFVPFGDAIANLAEDRLTRYVKVKITLQVDPTQAEAIQKLMGGPKKAIFNNWLIAYLSDKKLQDVRGANAINTMGREIQDGFNSLLADEGSYKVQRVLFEEFNVQ
jgi:flagellar basal body-associated protein FliL